MSDLVLKDKNGVPITYRDVKSVRVKNKNGVFETFSKSSGTKTITDNGLYDVIGFEKVYVQVSNSGSGETKLYKFNDTLDNSGTFETYEGVDYIPIEDFQNGMNVNIMSMTIDTEVIPVPDGGLPAVFYPTYIGSNFTLYIQTEYEGETIKSPFYMDFGNGDTHSDFSNTTFEIIEYGKYEAWFKANISPVGGGGDCSYEIYNGEYEVIE